MKGTVDTPGPSVPQNHNPPTKSGLRLIHHVFLPTQLPSINVDVETQIDDELKLLSEFFDCLSSFDGDAERICKTRDTFETWNDVQENLDPQTVADRIRSMCPGESFAAYIRRQNCGFMITILDPLDGESGIKFENGSGDCKARDPWVVEQAAISTFPVSLKCSRVTESCCGSFASVFPHVSVVVPKKQLLNSKALVRQLKDLSFFDMREAVSMARKGGTEVLESRDVTDPLYVSKWIVSVLCDKKSRASNAIEVPRVVKKMRDVVLFKEGIPWRRCGMWMTIKAVLQISLQKELGKINGLVVYKLVLLKFLTVYLNEGKLRGAEDWLVSEMMSKIGRRVWKLEKVINGDNETHCSQIRIEQWVRELCCELLYKVEASLRTVRVDVIENSLELRIANGKCFVDMRNLKLHVHHSLCHSNFDGLVQRLKESQDLKKRFERVGHDIAIPIPLTPLRHRDPMVLFDPHSFEMANEETGIVLCDFEGSIINWESFDLNWKYVWTVVLNYITSAREFYRNDPVGTSRMILSLLKVIKIWDKIVCKKFPIVQQHRAGVDLTICADLILPVKGDLESLEEIEGYFGQRDQLASFPSLIEETEVTVNSFAARFGGLHDTMRKTRDHIIEEGKVRSKQTLKQVEEARKCSEKILAEIRCRECEYEVDDYKLKHKRGCEKCRLEKRERSLSVQIYETPLPTGLERQNAVVFELLIPSDIAALRDLLYMLAQEISTTKKNDQGFYGPWSSYCQINSCNRRQGMWKVDLMSTRKLVLDTHYRSLHPSNPDSDFVKPNGYNCCYAGEGMYPVGLKAGNLPRLALKKRCTLKVEKGSRYCNMQWAINGDEVTPNEVLAMQNTCNRNMSLTEFKEFGSLRVGWKLQWKNLFRALTQCSLSLKEESVFHLICQTVWQAGPRNDEKFIFVRKAYTSLGSTGFPNQIIDLLDNIRRKHVDNWKDHYVLLTIILIAQRISSMRPDCIDAAADLIFCCRVDAVKWSKEIQRILSSLSNAPRNEIDDLRVKLIEVNICCALTFPIDDTLLSRVGMNRNDSWETWLCTVARIHDNLVLLGQEYKLSNTVRNLLRRVDEVGWYLENKIHEECANSNDGFLTRFVRSHHAASRNWQMDGLVWYPYPEALQVYHLQIPQEYRQPLELQMDIVKGRFLVDGCPVGYLPPMIENHQDFQRVFGKKCFEVQPYGAGYQTGRMITRDLYPSPGEEGSQYSFYLDVNQQLTVTEHRRMKGGIKEQKVELISHKYFKKNVPSLLVKKYSHWYNHTTHRFEFFCRDPEKVSKLQQATKKPEYELELDDCTIMSVLDRNNLIVDVNCADYIKVLQVIERLEHWKEINMWKKVNNNTVSFTVRLPRIGLSFVVNNVRQGLLVSQEYKGMKVAHVQEGLETLVGLKSGLLLEDAQINSKAKMNSLLLVPHGKVMINQDRVTINVEQIRNPPFFAYEVDTKLRQLKAGESRSGWAYLAYLHAATGQATVDPFTGVTGTERALQILQSGQCWSSEPLDDETVHTLEQIAELSCERHYYPASMMEMETTDWPYPPNISNDSFRLVVEKLIKDSLRLHFLHPEFEIQEVELRNTALQLNFKNYWRRSALTTEVGRITHKFDPIYEDIPTPAIIKSSEFDTDFMSEEMASGFFISQLIHHWGYFPPPDVSIAKGLLTSGKDLKGLFAEEGFPIKEGIYCWSRLLFRDYWLDLYNLARKVKKKDLKAEWALLLTYFGFRVSDRVSLNHLKLLQTVAVNSILFESIDPPPFESYSKTNEWVFDLQKLRAIVSRYIRPWERFADVMKQDQREFENDLDFGKRMQIIHQDIVLTQTQRILDLIGDFWPVDNCDKLLEHSAELSEIYLHECLMEINICVKNWFQNAQLVKFLREVEEKLAVLQTNVNYHTHFIDRRKTLTKTSHCKKDLEDKGEEMLSFIALDDLIDRRSGIPIDEIVWSEAKRSFEARGKQKVKSRICNPKPFPCSDSSDNARLPEFPLSIDIKHKNCPILREYMENLSDSWKLFHSTNAGELKAVKGDDEVMRDDFKTRHKNFEEALKLRKKETLERWDRVYTALKPRKEKMESAFGLSIGWRILFESGIFPRIIPLTVLPILLKSHYASNEGRTRAQWRWRDYLQDLIGAWGVSITLEHQAARCLRFHNAKNESELKAELSNRCANGEWSPSDKPEWLLLEIEMNLKVREIQAKVAKRMENSEGEENCLVQLNMGEGKTYVIVPLLVLSLADGSRLCRVTVLKSLYQMNKDSLIGKIGGILLNRRVYSFPCRRDYKIGPDESLEMLEVYQECMKQGGVVMTLPEHRLSFEIKAYERCHARSFEEARGMFRVQAFLRDHARDVLDESDEILHVKYQLVYTLGKQIGVGGGCLRWEVAQDLLQMVPEEIKHLLEQYGESYVEYKESNKSSFPHCRLLSRDCGLDLCLNLARKIVISKNYIPNVTKDKVDILIEFLTVEELSREKLNKILQLYPVEAHQDKLLTLRGMLACGVLVSCLMKRWRVNYGVNSTSSYRRVAVPFKAKDVASDRVEFGHPDIAIILTHLSYYYSGLTDAHLEHVFVLLYLEPDPHSLFESWRNLLKNKATISGLSGVNLNDFFQKTEVLFPALRHNMGVINFWLSRVVFPHEAKQFGWKVGCSPWDLCQDRKMTNHSTTGFSGTNDSQLLLPMTIKQADLNELRWTNGGVMKNLLQQERYEALPMGISGRDILNKLVWANIRVLIDVGALILELSNEQVAQEWLKILDKEVGVGEVVDAAVYFDEGDKLTVIDKLGIKTRFELSTYRTRLDRCVVYLDDVHTRGTDLKIPHGNDACVTLGKGVTKDKLVQGCMRMRKLGDGHRVVFWASQEVDNLIKIGLRQENKVNPDEKMRIGPKEVLEWTIQNNCDGIRDGFIHWASAGVYQAQKLSSLKLYNDSNHDDSDLVLLAENCSQKEQVDLKAMYGEVRTKQKFPTIVGHLLKRVEREIGKLMKRSKPSLRNEIPMLVEFFGNKVIKHSERYVGDLLRSTQLLDEEQERELEHEQEAEHHQELPGRAKSWDHAISDDITEFLHTGRLNGIERWAIKIPLTLKNSSLWSSYASDIWAKDVYATYDFSNVIRQATSKDMTDNFLRPVNWIVSVQQSEQEKTVLMLISPFEAEFYYDLFRLGKDCVGSLHMWAPRVGTNQSTLFENPALTLPYNPRSFHLNGQLKSVLLLFSGSSYFKNETEMMEYCWFTGFCPRPWGDEEEELFNEGGIVDGFVKKRGVLKYYDSPFKDNPEKLIRGITQRRFGTFAMDSHVGRIVFQGTRPVLD